MFIARLRRWLARLSANTPSRSSIRQHIELLEDRTAPANFIVMNTAESGAGSLRNAIDQANTLGGSNTITFDPGVAGQTITLTQNDTLNPFAFGPTALVVGTPTLANDLTIIADITQGITISGGGAKRIFGVLGGSTLTVQYVTLTGGNATGGRGGGLVTQAGGVPGGGGAGMGGAIFVAQGGTLSLVQSLLTGNTATGGAGGGAGSYGNVRTAGSGGGSAAFAGGDVTGSPGANIGASAGGGGVQGPGQGNAGTAGGIGGLDEAGGAAPGQSTASGNGNNGTAGGGGGGAGQYGGPGGSGVIVSSGGFGGGGGGAWGINGGSGNFGGQGGFGAGGGGGFWGGGNGGFGGGAGSQWGGGTLGVPGFGGGGASGSGNVWGNAGGGGAGMGGAIFNNGGTVTMVNSTLAGNTATGGAGGASYSNRAGFGGSGFGGALFNRNGTVTITNSTIANNTVVAGAAGAGTGGGGAGSAGGGGIYTLSDGSGAAVLTVANTIVSGSTGPSDVVNNRNGGAGTATITAAMPNIVQTAIVTQNGAVTDDSGVQNIDPQLGALTGNGGPTDTMLPGAGPAIDSGDNAAAAGLIADQRGFVGRIINGTVDIGAVEVDAQPRVSIAVGPSAGADGVVNAYDRAGTLLFSVTPYGGAVKGGIRVAVGDVSGDGQPDIITGRGSGRARIMVIDGATGDPLATLPSGFLAYGRSFSGGVFVAAGDVFNNDGIAEIIVAPQSGKGKVKVLAGTGTQLLSFYPFGASFTGGVRVAAGDVAGGPGDEIVVMRGQGSSKVRIFSNTATELGSFKAAGSSNNSIAVGNVDGTGFAEIIVGLKAEVRVFDSTGATVGNTLMPYAGYKGKIRVAAVDMNGDGSADIVTGTAGRHDAEVRVFDAVSLVQLDSFFAYPDHLRGIFVSAG